MSSILNQYNNCSILGEEAISEDIILNADEYEKLDIDPSYIYDVQIEVNDMYVILMCEGKKYHLTSLVVTRQSRDSEPQIVLNITEDYIEYYQVGINEVERSKEYSKKIISFVENNLDKYGY